MITRRLLYKLIRQTKRVYPYGLNAHFRGRLQEYMYGSYHFGKIHAVMAGDKLLVNERRALAMAGAFLGIGDSIFDDKHDFKHNRIHDIITRPGDYTPLYFKDALLLNVYKTLLHNVPAHHRQPLVEALTAAYFANVESEKQKSIHAPVETVANATMQKGGFCGVFYRMCIKAPLIDDEYNAVFALGGVGQLIDDAFDIQEDKKTGVATLFSIEDDIDIIRGKFMYYYNDAIAKVNLLTYPPINIGRAITLFRFVSNLCLIFFYHLKHNVAQNNSISHITKTSYSNIKFRYNRGNLLYVFHVYFLKQYYY